MLRDPLAGDVGLVFSLEGDGKGSRDLDGRLPSKCFAV